MRGLVVGLVLVLAACGRSEPPSFTERTLENQLRVARLDFQAGRYGLAADGFAVALETAWSLDEPAAIGTAGSEYALSLLRDDRPDEAARAAARLLADFDRRGAEPPAMLDLVAGAAAVRLDDPAAAEIALRPRTDDADDAVRERAWYLLGLAAAARADAGGLERAAAQLEAAMRPLAAADAAELRARLALLRGQPGQALEHLAELRAGRRDLDDLDGLGEALALSGRAAEALGQPLVAADFYLRAARNAAARGRVARALAWADAAQRLDAGGLGDDVARLRRGLASG